MDLFLTKTIFHDFYFLLLPRFLNKTDWIKLAAASAVTVQCCVCISLNEGDE